MLPLLTLMWQLAQPPVSQPFKDDSVTSAALGRTLKYRGLLPAGYERARAQYRALYQRHGLTGDYKDCSTRTSRASPGHCRS